MDKYTRKTTINAWVSQIKFEKLEKRIQDKTQTFTSESGQRSEAEIGFRFAP